MFWILFLVAWVLISIFNYGAMAAEYLYLFPHDITPNWYFAVAATGPCCFPLALLKVFVYGLQFKPLPFEQRYLLYCNRFDYKPADQWARTMFKGKYADRQNPLLGYLKSRHKVRTAIKSWRQGSTEIERR